MSAEGDLPFNLFSEEEIIEVDNSSSRIELPSEPESVFSEETVVQQSPDRNKQTDTFEIHLRINEGESSNSSEALQPEDITSADQPLATDGAGSASHEQVLDLATNPNLPPPKKQKLNVKSKPDINKQTREKFQKNCGGIKKKMAVVSENLRAKDRRVEMFFKARYITPTGKPYLFKEGTDFVYPGDSEETVADSKTTDAITDAVLKGMDSKLAPLILAANKQLEPQTSTISGIPTFSPQKLQVIPKKKDTCCVCHHKDAMVKYRKYDSEWIRCSGDSKECSTCVHVFCLGFPGASQKAIEENFPDFYCPEHIEYGAGLKDVSSSLVSSPAAAKSASATTSSATKLSSAAKTVASKPRAKSSFAEPDQIPSKTRQGRRNN